MARAAATKISPERLRRRSDILTRINGSGDISDTTEAIKVAKEIEEYEYADGDGDQQSARSNLTRSMLGSGSVHMRDIVAKATDALTALAS